MNFESLKLHPAIMDGLRAMRYTAPTLLQSLAIPPALEGRDVIGLGRNGAGKTAACALAILQRLRAVEKEGVRALVVSPESESAESALELINSFGENIGLESTGIYEGVSIEKQLRALRYRPAIIIASPGRLMDHLWKGSVKLMDLEILAIDDADSLLEAGFLAEIRNILGYIGHPHQTLLFSASLPDGLRRFIKESLHDPVTVQGDRSLPENRGTSTRDRLEHYLKSLQWKNHSR